MRIFFTTIVILLTFIFSGCAPKEVNLATINPVLNVLQQETISVYDSDRDMIIVYSFFLKDARLVESDWGKVLPFRVEFMDLWVTGLGHDLRRLTHNHAETIKDALMYAAADRGMIPLHVNQRDYIIDNKFATDMIDIINSYEEKMKRYERDRMYPLILLRR